MQVGIWKDAGNNDFFYIYMSHFTEIKWCLEALNASIWILVGDTENVRHKSCKSFIIQTDICLSRPKVNLCNIRGK